MFGDGLRDPVAVQAEELHKVAVRGIRIGDEPQVAIGGERDAARLQCVELSAPADCASFVNSLRKASSWQLWAEALAS